MTMWMSAGEVTVRTNEEDTDTKVRGKCRTFRGNMEGFVKNGAWMILWMILKAFKMQE